MNVIRRIKELFPQRLKNIYHLSQAISANVIYGFPSKRLTVIGITGTNGKTTVCQMVAKILEEAGAKVAMVSTINFKIREKESVNKTKYTTLSSFQVQKFIKRAVQSRCNYLVLEVSSHSLDQFRVWGIKFKTAVITNITREHLDYHETIDNYRLAKLRLFNSVKTAIVNLDMENPEDFLDCEAEEKYAFSIKYDASSSMHDKFDKNFKNINLIQAKNIKLNANNSEYMIHDASYILHLPGEFNIENALAATCVGLSENVNLEKIKTTLEKIKGVPGRLEHVPNDKGINIIIDYALTPDSLEKLYTYIKSIKKESSKVISVFGACGERDKGKRPIMGRIAGKYADFVIVTNEDPYFEDPEQIINEVFSGVVSANGDRKLLNHKEEKINCWRIMDRREAIKKSLKLAKPGDIVVVTGKGAEEIMAIGKKRIPWNDKRVILEELKNI